MNDISFISLNKIRSRLVMNLYNQIYSDYHFEIHHDIISFKHYLKKLPANLELSQVIKVKNTLVGLAIISLVNNKAWISSLGIIKEHRGQGLGDSLLKKVIYNIKEAGGHQIGLEVLDFNYPANRLYKKYGFEILSKLTSLEGKLNSNKKCDLELVRLSFSEVEKYLEDTSMYVWSRRKHSLSKTTEWVGMKSNEELLVLMGYETDDSIIVKRIQPLKNDADIIANLFNVLAKKYEFNKKYYLLNFSDNERKVITLAKQFGLKEFLVQNLLELNI
ncbi:MAG: GNAT family N-acetyltransferase [Clostridia bacterium]